MYFCCSWTVVSLGELPHWSVCIPGSSFVFQCCYVLGVLFVCYTLYWVLLDEFPYVVVLVLFFVIWIDFDFRCWFSIKLLLNTSNLTD